jgi:lipid II:glycine glycyltransferase (peptidoglycan interpeptide bridge formation enzyme)
LTEVREATEAELADWDAATVHAPGGHVYQSRAWAEHRTRAGWRPRFLITSDGGAVVALLRPWPIIGGASGYVPRGPAPVVDGATTARRLIETGRWLARQGVDVLAADPEVPASEEAFGKSLRAARFQPIEEIQPSRHRISLPLGEGADDDAVLHEVAKSTRQRIRKAEEGGIDVVRYDARLGDGGVGEGFVAPHVRPAAALDRFYGLLLETGERRHFSFGPRAEFVGWWRRALAAGHLVYLEARGADEPLAGLILYRHGGRLTTVHSGDRAGSRRTHPGALHLLRWRAIQLAIREACSEMDLGGADLPGARREPREGEPMYGLYQHKLSFGARWVKLTGAHERVYRRNRYRAGRIVAAVARRARRAGR